MTLSLRGRLAILALAAQLAACSAPTEKDIVGVWRGTDGASLEFRQDRTFMGRALPGPVFFRETASAAVLDGSGTWQLKQSNGVWVLLLSFKKSTALPGGFGMQVWVSGSGPGTTLFVWTSDPDSGKRYELTR